MEHRLTIFLLLYYIDPRKQGKPEEMTEEMQQLQRENEKKLRDKRLLPAAKHNRITGIFNFVINDL